MNQEITEIPRLSNNNVESASIEIGETSLSAVAVLARKMLESHRIPQALLPLEKHYHIIPYVLYAPIDPSMIRREVFPWYVDSTVIEIDEVEEIENRVWDTSTKDQSSSLSSRMRIIHMARKKSGNGGYPWEFVGPLDASDLTVSIVGKPRGLATELIIRDEKWRQYPIVATRYPIRDKEKGFREVITSPYEPGTMTEENLAYGQLYSAFLFARVEWELLRNPPSWLPKELLPLFSDVIRGISLIENMDPSEYQKLDDTKRSELMSEQIDRIYAILWLNGPLSFRRDSSAWARGFYQIIEPTWNQLRRDYPHPLTDKEFQTGAIDHMPACIMAYAHLTQEYKEYMKYPRIQSYFANGWEKYLPYFLAAWYNSNVSGRAAELDRILSFKGGGKILPRSPDEVFSLFFLNMRHANPKETEWYMKKLEFVWTKHLWMELPPTPIR
jgi:hypothetical protein